MHKVHHHFELPYTDSNYGNIFSLWDRLFGTYMELSKNEIIYGIDTDVDEPSVDVGNMAGDQALADIKAEL